MTLTGREGGLLLGPPAGMVPKLRGFADDIARISGRLGREVTIDPIALLGERAAIAGLGRRGDTSCGGATRLVRCANTWIAISLTRPEDVELVPAWLERDCGDDPWEAIDRAAAALAPPELVARGRLLGLAVAALPRDLRGDDRPSPDASSLGSPLAGPDTVRMPLDETVVADLSSLWAGPLCGALLAAAGARVVKVESTLRPDGARKGPPAFFDLLNGQKRSVALDFGEADGRRVLRELLRRVDVVIEASRPRALEQLGVDARTLVEGGGPRAWVSVTGYGRQGLERDWVAFGDDAAVAGGLVVWDAQGPCFCADAVADPAAGMVAAASVLKALDRGGRRLIDVSLAGVAAGLAGPTLPSDGAVSARPAHARPAIAPAPRLGADTDSVLAELGIPG